MSLTRTYDMLFDTEDGRWYVNEYISTSSGTHRRTLVEGLDERTALQVVRAGDRFQRALNRAIEKARAKGYLPR